MQLKRVLAATMILAVVALPILGRPVSNCAPVGAMEKRVPTTPTTADRTWIVVPEGAEASDSQLEDANGEGFIGWLGGTVFGAITGVIFAPFAYIAHTIIYRAPFTASGLSRSIVDGAVGGATTGAIVGLLLPEP